MKIILTQEVAGVGSAGDVTEVKDGYARNFLIPRGYAIRWTRGAESQVHSMRKARDARAIRDQDTAADVRDRLVATPVTITVRAGEGGRLFGAITPGDVATAIQQTVGVEVDRRRVEVAAPIKAVGTHTVRVKLHPEVTADVTLDVREG
jgi:large subunit ribosomal protein L9